MARNLTEMQQKFLFYLFGDAKGDANTAKKLAGYSDNVATSQVVSSLMTEIGEATRNFLSGKAAKAAWGMSEVMDSPTDLGNKEKIAAAKDILDRAGFGKVEKVEVKTETPLFILPAKKDE